MLPLPQNAAELAQNLASPETRALGCHAETCMDVVETVRHALANPLGFDSLNQITVPGDQIVIAVADVLPCMELIVEGTVESLLEAGAAPGNITILLPEKYQPRIDELRMRSLEPVHWACHHPDQEEEMAYLATTDEGRAIILNRLLTDADLVIPLGCFRSGTAYDHFGIHTPIFPTFTDRKTMAEFGSVKSQDTRGRRHKRHVHEADRIGWLLGIAFSIQIIPGRAGQVLEIIAGDAEQVKHEAIRSYRQAWHHEISQQAGLVVSILDEPTNEGIETSQAHWAALAQSLTDAVALTEPDGAIVILTNLAEEPGPAIQALIDSQDPENTLQAIRKSKLEDAQTAARLAELVEQRKIYLMSGLEDQMVEDLRMTPINTENEITRLSERYSTALVLEGAPFISTTIRQGE